MSLYPRKGVLSLPEGLRSPYLGWPLEYENPDSGTFLQRVVVEGEERPSELGWAALMTTLWRVLPLSLPVLQPHPGTVGLPGRVTHESFLRHSGESLERQCHHAAMYQRQGIRCRVSGTCSFLVSHTQPRGHLLAGQGGGWRSGQSKHLPARRRGER